MTNEPIEVYPERVWEIHDPNTARLVAIFYEEDAAMEYLRWRNRENKDE